MHKKDGVASEPMLIKVFLLVLVLILSTIFVPVMNYVKSSDIDPLNKTENQTDTKNISSICIMDKKHEQMQVVPGTRFYVERTINGSKETNVTFVPMYSNALTLESIEIIDDKPNNIEKKNNNSDKEEPSIFDKGKSESKKEQKIEDLKNDLPDEIKSLDKIAYEDVELHSPRTVRLWFRAPTWEKVQSGKKTSSGEISYLVFSNDSADDFDFEGSTWWSSNWEHRKLITINSSQVESDLTNFPILVNITDSDLRDDAQNDGDDIAFVLWNDNTTQLNHQIESFDGGTGELTAWVNVTSLSSSIDTKIWMYYNNSGASNQQNSAGVWDSNYVGVWHLNETGFVDRSDSTSKYNNGTTSGYEGDESAIGKISGADDFDGTDDHINSTNNLGISGNAVRTITFWANPDDTTRSGMVGWGVDGDSQQYEAAIRNNTYFLWGWGGGNDWNTSETPDTGKWSYHTITHNGTKSRWYINCIELGSGFTHTYNTADTPLMIAYENDVGTQNYFEGLIDEIRISNIVRNNSWINTSYNTMNSSDTFISIGNEKSMVPPSIDLISPAPNGTTGIAKQPTCKIWANDTNGDTLTVSWYENTTESYVLRNTNNSVPANSIVSYSFSEFNSYNTTYYWSVRVFDGILWTNSTYHFKTEEEPNFTPKINSYDLKNKTGSKLNNQTGSIDNEEEYYFEINISDKNGWGDINYINITAWYDNGDDTSDYNDTKGGNRNMFLQYKNISGTKEFNLIWPDEEVEIIDGNCSEAIVNSSTRIIKISFKTQGQVRWAPGDGIWGLTQNTTDDTNSWNFNISVVDSSKLKDWKKDEYAISRYTSIKKETKFLYVNVIPGYTAETNVIDIEYSTNFDYNMSIYFEKNLTNSTSGAEIFIEDHVYILEKADSDDDITVDKKFEGTGEKNKIEIFNNSGLFQSENNTQSVQIQFEVGVPIGTYSGKYTSSLATELIQKNI